MQPESGRVNFGGIDFESVDQTAQNMRRMDTIHEWFCSRIARKCRGETEQMCFVTDAGRKSKKLTGFVVAFYSSKVPKVRG